MTNVSILTLSGLIMAAALAGCSSSNYNSAPQANPSTWTQYKPVSTDYMPNYMASTSIGRVMTTPQGSTVYTFDEDQIGKSNPPGSVSRRDTEKKRGESHHDYVFGA